MRLSRKQHIDSGRPNQDHTGLPKGRVSLRALSSEALSSIVERPGRSILTALGTVLGVAVLLGVLGLTSSASVQVSSRFNLVEATQVTVRPVEGYDFTSLPSQQFPANSEEIVNQINGVEQSGIVWTLIHAEPKTGKKTTAGSVLAVTPGVFDFAGVNIQKGRTFDYGHQTRKSQVCVIGSGAARELGIFDLELAPAITIRGVPFTVIGIVDDTKRMPEMLSGVMIPHQSALHLWGGINQQIGEESVIKVAVKPGAAKVVGEQLPLALSPKTPSQYKVDLPPDPQGLRKAIDEQLSGLFVILAGVCLVVGMVGIANTTFVAVIERTGEIGLRRAMGAKANQIATQFLFEATILGAVGGLFGTSIGVIAVVSICSSLKWTAVIHTSLIFLGPLIGMVSGALAGLYPALKASKIEPVEALRQ